MALRSISKLARLARYFEASDSVYPLERKAVAIGAIAGLITGILLLDILAGFAVFVLSVIVGLLWRQDEPPVLVYCLAYQWVFVAIGYFYELLTGTFPSSSFPVGDLEGATFLSLLGFLAIVFGLRVGMRLLAKRISIHDRLTARAPRYNLKTLFWVVIVLFTINWFLEILPREIAFNEAQLIANVLSVRDVLITLLFLSIFSQRKHYVLGVIAAVFVSLPQSTSQHSAFSAVFIIIGIALLREWRPWSKLAVDRIWNRRILGASVVLGFALFFMGVVWQGGVKETWRYTLRSETQLSTPISKMSSLASIIEDVYVNLNWGAALDSLAERLSGTLYFSHCLNYVPRVTPHENGALTWRAIEHTFKPRVLFPNKPNLGSNSWLIWQYTGLPAAGEESETSIGLTYMAEFYVDYGRYLMFIPLFAWGLIIGLVYSGLFLIAPSQLFACATVMVLLPQPFASYEGEIAYMLGGLLQAGLVFAVVIYFVGPWTHRWLLDRGELRRIRSLGDPSPSPLPD